MAMFKSMSPATAGSSSQDRRGLFNGPVGSYGLPVERQDYPGVMRSESSQYGWGALNTIAPRHEGPPVNQTLVKPEVSRVELDTTADEIRESVDLMYSELMRLDSERKDEVQKTTAKNAELRKENSKLSLENSATKRALARREAELTELQDELNRYKTILKRLADSEDSIRATLEDAGLVSGVAAKETDAPTDKV